MELLKSISNFRFHNSFLNNINYNNLLETVRCCYQRLKVNCGVTLGPWVWCLRLGQLLWCRNKYKAGMVIRASLLQDEGKTREGEIHLKKGMGRLARDRNAQQWLGCRLLLREGAVVWNLEVAVTPPLWAGPLCSCCTVKIEGKGLHIGVPLSGLVPQVMFL